MKDSFHCRRFARVGKAGFKMCSRAGVASSTGSDTQQRWALFRRVRSKAWFSYVGNVHRR